MVTDDIQFWAISFSTRIGSASLPDIRPVWYYGYPTDIFYNNGLFSCLCFEEQDLR